MPRTDDEIIALLQDASISMKTANFEKALATFEELLGSNDPNVTKFAASLQGMRGECLLSLARPLYDLFPVFLRLFKQFSNPQQ